DIVRGRWKDRRGCTFFRSFAAVVGSFPGAISRGHRIGRSRLTITERYLVCNEGRKQGFAIDVDDILDVAIVPAPSGVMSALRIRYLDAGNKHLVRSFAFYLRGATVSLYGVRRVRALARLFADAGIPVVDDATVHSPHRLALTWDAARRHSPELMVWSGKASAPVGGWMARDRKACRVWLTGKSLFWCDPSGTGVNRIPLEDIVDISADPGADVPALVVALIDATDTRQELLFGFDGARDQETNRWECQTLINAFASRDVTIIEPGVPAVPWMASRSPTRSVAKPVAVVRMMDTDDDVASEGSPECLVGEAPASFTMFEADCLAEIVAINQQIIDPGPSLAGASAVEHGTPSPVLREALDAITLHLADGSMEIEDADNRVRRLELLSDSRSKLRAIRQQQIVGLRAKSALLHERRAVMMSLSDIMT
ncbi:MAG: hypothetical protein ACR2OU_17675, partial [Thermomicrobiales bacterium]